MWEKSVRNNHSSKKTAIGKTQGAKRQRDRKKAGPDSSGRPGPCPPLIHQCEEFLLSQDYRARPRRQPRTGYGTMQRGKNADAWIQGAKHIRSKEVTHTQRSCIQGREFTQKHKLKYPHEKQRRARTQPTRSLHGGTSNKRAMILDTGLWWRLTRMRDLRSSGRNTWPQICGSRFFSNSGPVTQDYS